MPTLIRPRDARGIAHGTTNVRVAHIGGEATMSTVPWLGYKAPDPVYEEFTQLAEEWRAETGHLSSATQIAMHPAYQRIIGLGEPAIPLILEALRERGGQWYWALNAITNASPVPADQEGRVQGMNEAWLDWGARHGYIDTSA